MKISQSHIIVSILMLYCIICDNTTFAVIYSLNESEYNKLPALFELDNYKRCMLEADGKYCIVNAELYTETPSQLFDVIKNYSAFSQQHFNHTRIHRGICYTNCYKHPNLTLDDNIEGCLNATIYDQYDLQVRLLSVEYCETAGQTMPIDVYCYVVALVYLIIIVLNVAATVYDMKLDNNEQNLKVNPWVISFSVRRNWIKLTTDNSNTKEQTDRFKSIHGLRSMTMIAVIFSHVVFLNVYGYVANPRYVEISYDNVFKQFMYNGALVVQTFFSLSAFLLSYNYLMRLEKCKLTFWDYPMGILNRWLRLTPVYLLTIATISTWLPHLGEGPLWRRMVTSESLKCRTNWWQHILYINNYFWHDVGCMPQAWYLAADMQLFIWGLALVILGQYLNERNRKIMWILALIISFIPTPLQVYIQDLDAIVIQTPETIRAIYRDNQNFKLYVGGHTNVFTYTVALVAAIYYYNILKRNDTKLQNSKIFLHTYYASFPLGVCVFLSGIIWYKTEHTPIFFRMLYASLYKLTSVIIILTIMIGTFLKIERIYRGIMESNVWLVSGRISYCGYLLHTLVQRPIYGLTQHTVYISDYNVIAMLAASLFIVLCLSLLMALLVELPLSNLQKLIFEKKKRTIKILTPENLTNNIVTDENKNTSTTLHINIDNSKL